MAMEGTSYGLCQWHDGRFDALQSFCLLQGYDYWSLEGQLNYLAYESSEPGTRVHMPL